MEWAGRSGSGNDLKTPPRERPGTGPAGQGGTRGQMGRSTASTGRARRGRLS
ncbi:MAG: hypothetical protein M0C28_48510 [Candidatus Moduliflexus flocculans]|nr:hypothetical protein [Candidatus Moduliflexus flocculans]